MRLFRRLAKNNPFSGNYLPSRVPLFARGSASFPFPHLWNYREPMRILDAYFQQEVGLVVGAFVKVFRFTADSETVNPRASVSKKPDDGVTIKIEVRKPYQ